jgi:hypothetical protein
MYWTQSPPYITVYYRNTLSSIQNNITCLNFLCTFSIQNNCNQSLIYLLPFRTICPIKPNPWVLSLPQCIIISFIYWSCLCNNVSVVSSTTLLNMYISCDQYIVNSWCSCCLFYYEWQLTPIDLKYNSNMFCYSEYATCLSTYNADCQFWCFLWSMYLNDSQHITIVIICWLAGYYDKSERLLIQLTCPWKMCLYEDLYALWWSSMTQVI